MALDPTKLLWKQDVVHSYITLHLKIWVYGFETCKIKGLKNQIWMCSLEMIHLKVESQIRISFLIFYVFADLNLTQAPKISSIMVLVYPETPLHWNSLFMGLKLFCDKGSGDERWDGRRGDHLTGQGHTSKKILTPNQAALEGLQLGSFKSPAKWPFHQRWDRSPYFPSLLGKCIQTDSLSQM